MGGLVIPSHSIYVLENEYPYLQLLKTNLTNNTEAAEKANMGRRRCHSKDGEKRFLQTPAGGKRH